MEAKVIMQRPVPRKRKKGQVHTQMAGTNIKESDVEDELVYVYHQSLPGLNWKTCLLIDCKSSIDIFNNAELLTKIHPAMKHLKLHCNAGYIYVTKKGWFGGIEVWYHQRDIANILSHKTLKKRHHMTYDSKDRDKVFKVHTSQGVVEFIPHKSGLHYLDLKNNEEDGTALVTTIKENFERFTKKQVEGAIKAHCFQAMLGHPSRKDFKSMVHANLIAKCCDPRKYLSCSSTLW